MRGQLLLGILTLFFLPAIEGRRKRICQDKRSTISCNSRHVIDVTHATFGRRGRGICRTGFIRRSHCGRTNNVREEVKKECNGKRMCSLTASSRIYQHPCEGTPVYLDIVWRCRRVSSISSNSNSNSNSNTAAGNEVRHRTPNRQRYIILSTLGITVPKEKFFHFQVKACHDVHVALISGDTENDPLYEIVIGGWRNSQSVIRTQKQGRPVKTARGSVVSCSQYRKFWISWNDKTIEVGRGDNKNSGRFMTWTQRSGLKDIKNIGIYTAFGSSGEWIFYKQGSKGPSGCTDNQFTCVRSKKCIDKSKVCNRKNDCSDASDERNCPLRGCTDNQFTCVRSRKCIDKSNICDRRSDCSDGSDERNCPPRDCEDNQFTCVRSKKCIDKSRVCNRRRDCNDWSDERNCPRGCTDNQFTCVRSRRCVDKSRMCNRRRDCSDGSDERNCPRGCTDNQFTCSRSRRCIDKSRVCNRRRDCNDWSDERNCPRGCTDNQFTCARTKRCIDKSKVCNRRNDCSDGSDERNCPCQSTEFTCVTSKKCIPKSLLCNRKNDCKDGSDEKKCACKSTEFTCAASKNCIPKTSVCNRKNDCTDGSDEKNCPCTTTEFECVTSKKCIPKSLVCNRKNDCKDGSDEKNCPCTTTEFECVTSKKCIPKSLVCNKKNDCKDGSDEKNCPCTTTEFECVTSKKCITKSLVCNKKNDCKDGSDEKNCPSKQPKCGVQEIKPVGLSRCGRTRHRLRIVGGCKTEPHSWPWAVQLRLKLEGEDKYVHECGGAIVGPRHVLTASHCFLSQSDPAYWKVVAGRHFKNKDEDTNQIKMVKKIDRHRNPTNNPLDRDFAVVEVTTPFTFNKYVTPVCLPTGVPKENDFCVVVGWGKTEGTGFEDILKQVLMPIVDVKTCNGSGSNLAGEITDYMLCAGFEEGKQDACQGDSGGPLVCRYNGVYRLQGVVSWGIDCAKPEYPGVYANVFKIVQWINAIIK